MTFGKQLSADLAHTLAQLSADERERLRGATVLMTGCAGFIGYYYM